MSEQSGFHQPARLLGAENATAAKRALGSIAELGLPQDLVDSFLQQLNEYLPNASDAERALNNIIRFLQASRSPQSWLALFEREPDALKTLVQLFSSSQYMADILVTDPEVFDLIRMTGGQPVEKSVLQDEILAEIGTASDVKTVMRILRDYRHRETLRIAYGDFVLGQLFETVTEQLSNLAESIVHAAVVAAQQEVVRRRPMPSAALEQPVRFCVLALGKLGGAELNYSSDIDLIFVYDSVLERNFSKTSSHSEAHIAEHFHRVGQLIIRLLSESTPRGIAYRVDMRLRPFGAQGPLVVSCDRAFNYYDSAGRTWERQAFVKARAVAGDVGLGNELIVKLQPWIYRRYLNRADITGLAALKRRIEQRSKSAGDNERNVKLGHGGIRDIETVIQFLQLLHGSDAPSVRETSTLGAIRELRRAGCLTGDEQGVLEDNYRLLRRVEHYLQIMYDRQTHTLPSEAVEFAKFASRIGYRDTGDKRAEEVLREHLHHATQLNRRILDHVLHDAFGGDEIASVESDLILDPEPSDEMIRSTLGPYGFHDVFAAYRNLLALSVESIAFLSTRRCRHFLAAIAPKLLAAIAATPSADATLISLANVTDSLGGKAVLWELFSANPPSLELCVRMCACSPYLANILTSSPGMIDELMDSLMLDALPSHEELTSALAELCRGASDISAILQNFKNSMHLRVGVRDILGKSTIAQTHIALSDIAEVCLEQVVYHEFHRLVHQLGVPVCDAPESNGKAAELVILAVGKLGGREPNYHSDLDIIFLFDGEGTTKSLVPNRRFESTTNRHFFNQLCQRVIHAATRVGATGRLFDLDVRLRPLGRSGELAISIDDLQRYFSAGGGQVWERQALCKARPIWGSETAQAAAMNCIRGVLSDSDWTPQQTQQMLLHRLQLQKGASENNLKRSVGGTMDVEFVVQLLQLACAAKVPEVLVPGTLEALRKLCEAGSIDQGTADELQHDYEFLRSVESGIRLMNMSARHEIPSEELELNRLAFLMSRSRGPMTLDGSTLLAKCNEVRQHIRSVFDTVFAMHLPTDSHT